MSAINFFIAPFDYDFMQHAFLAGTLAAILASTVGFFVVVRQLGFAAHALSHVGFAGATGAVLLGWLPLIGQLLITLIAGLLMGLGSKKMKEQDTMIGITLALALGIGVLFMHFYRAYGGQLNSILFGDILGVSAFAIHWMFWLTILSLLALGVISRPLWFASLAPTLAEAKSLSLLGLSLLFFSILAVTITLASQVVGILLVFTLVVGPPAISLQWTKYFWSGLMLSCVLGLFIVWISIYAAYYTDWAVSFWISALVFVCYMLGKLEWRKTKKWAKSSY